MKRKVFFCFEKNNNNDTNKITNALWLVRITITSLQRQMEFLEFVCFVEPFRMDKTKEKQIHLWFRIISCVYSYFHLSNWSVDCIDGLEFFFLYTGATRYRCAQFVNDERINIMYIWSELLICLWCQLNFEFSIDYQFMLNASKFRQRLLEILLI